MAMAIRIRVLLLFLFFLSLSHPTFSLYQDQLGLMAWHALLSSSVLLGFRMLLCFDIEVKSSLGNQLIIDVRHQQYIGKVKHAVFHTQKAGRKRVVVSTEENVIASLDLRRGEICQYFAFLFKIESMI